jgi:sugar/nucleoside kinase (ribokinase family)
MAAGHVCLDIIPKFRAGKAATLTELLRPGKLLEMGGASICTGGPVSNTGIGLKLLGHRVCFSARLGDDEFGQITLDHLQRNGNAGGMRMIEGCTSSYTIVIAPPGIDRIFLHDPGANNEYCADDLDTELIAQCVHFHFGYPPLMRRIWSDAGAELERVFATAKRAGATTSCDMALPDPASEAGKAPWYAILERILPHVDIFLPSIEEALYMLEPETFLRTKAEHGGAGLIDLLTPADYGRIATKLLALGTRIVAHCDAQIGAPRHLSENTACRFIRYDGSRPSRSCTQLVCTGIVVPGVSRTPSRECHRLGRFRHRRVPGRVPAREQR